MPQSIPVSTDSRGRACRGAAGLRIAHFIFIFDNWGDGVTGFGNNMASSPSLLFQGGLGHGGRVDGFVKRHRWSLLR